MEKVMGYLSIVGAVAVGLPVLLHSLVVFFKVIPGDQPDKILEKLQMVSEEIANLIGKLFPKKP
jgi:hypothetical protein